MVKLFVTIITLFFTIFFSKNVFASGYTIDLRENNPIYQEQFDKFELVFNFEKRTVNQIVKLSKKYRDNISLFQEINRQHNIIAMNDKEIIFEESYREHLDFMHKTYLDDDYLVGSKYYKKKYKKMVEESGDLDSPFHRVKFNLNTLEYTETTNPLTKNAKVEKSSFLYNETGHKNKIQMEEFVKAAVFVATVYLLINNHREIKKIEKAAKQKSSSISTSTTTFKNPAIGTCGRCEDPNFLPGLFKNAPQGSIMRTKNFKRWFVTNRM